MDQFVIIIFRCKWMCISPKINKLSLSIYSGLVKKGIPILDDWRVVYPLERIVNRWFTLRSSNMACWKVHYEYYCVVSY